MFQSRTHNCGELRLADAGAKVKIVGWMENVREVSASLAFVVVRERSSTIPDQPTGEVEVVPEKVEILG